MTFYVDGFNFYYGLRASKKNDSDWARYYWIDFVKLFQSFLSDGQELEKVIYFTASPLNVEKSRRQSALLNANKILNGDRFEIVRGKYIEKQITCPNCNFSIPRPEEKKTDVNISVRMLADSIMDKTDVIVLVSADSDLLPPLEFIQRNTSKRVRIYFPPSRYSDELKDNMLHHSSKPVLLWKNKRRFEGAIMPESVVGEGRVYTKPEKWA